MSYPGSKGQAGTFQTIIGQMPPHSVYVEPFFGSGQVFWRKARAASSIVFDKRPDLIAKAGAEAGVMARPGDALELLPALAPALTADTVVYCDPPYLLSTRSRQGRFYYEHEMTDDHHASLLALLQALPCRVLLSGYPSDLYRSQLQSWRCISYRTRTRGRSVTECLWCNYPEPATLHDWRYAGKNYRERLYLKRLAKRWIKKLDAMSDKKRGYMLDAIAQRKDWRVAPALSATNGDGARRSSAPDPALQASQMVTVKLIERKEGPETVHVAKCYLGRMLIFETMPRAVRFQAMVDAQDWALEHGKKLQYDRADL